MQCINPGNDLTNQERYQLNGSFENQLRYDAPLVDSMIGIPSIIETGRKVSAIRNVFLSILPQGIELQEALQKGNFVWMFLNKTHGNERETFPSLESFSAYATAEGTIYDIARIVHILAYISAVDVDRVTMAVEKLVLSDDKYMSSLDGLHCLVLQGLLYNESGQL